MGLRGGKKIGECGKEWVENLNKLDEWDKERWSWKDWEETGRNWYEETSVDE